MYFNISYLLDINFILYLLGVERGSGRCFFQIVQKRDKATLLSLIEQWIKPNTVVITDMWRSYNGLDKLSPGYQHLSVNHSITFVDPEDHSIHTNSIEGTWGHMKSKLRRLNINCY